MIKDEIANMNMETVSGTYGQSSMPLEARKAYYVKKMLENQADYYGMKITESMINKIIASDSAPPPPKKKPITEADIMGQRILDL